MKTLLILRHAKSNWNHPGLADHDRPLNKRGKRDAPKMGQLLLDESLLPDLIISSTAKRARETAGRIARASGYEGPVVETRDLYHAFPEEHLSVLKNHAGKNERVMIVAHNPGLEELLQALTGQAERLPTAALAQVTLPIDHWPDLTLETKGTLVNLWRPKELAG